MQKNHFEIPSLSQLEAKASEIDKLTSISQHPADSSIPVFNCLLSCSGGCSLSCGGDCGGGCKIGCGGTCEGGCAGGCKGGFF